MCLNAITSGAEPEAEGMGYKVFALVDNLLTSAILLNMTFKVGEWVVDDCQKVCWTTNGGQKASCYWSGFHLFEKKEDAEAFAGDYPGKRFDKATNFERHLCVRKVRYRNVTATGLQVTDWDAEKHKMHRANCIVSKEIFIEPEGEQQCA
jgi:hypothetical protein